MQNVSFPDFFDVSVSESSADSISAIKSGKDANLMGAKSYRRRCMKCDRHHLFLFEIKTIASKYYL